MARGFECKGLNCPYVMLGETTVYHDDSRFRECQQVLNEEPAPAIINPQSVKKNFFTGDLDVENMCGYAVQAIRKTQGWDSSHSTQEEANNGKF